MAIRELVFVYFWVFKHQALIDRRLDESTRRLMGPSSVCTFCLSASKIKNQHVSTTPPPINNKPETL